MLEIFFYKCCLLKNQNTFLKIHTFMNIWINVWMPNPMTYNATIRKNEEQDRLVILKLILKGSYDVAKKNIILWSLCNAMRLCGLGFKKNIFHILYIIVAPLCFIFLKHFTQLIILSSDWSAIWCILIGQIPQACDRNVKHLTVLWCRVTHLGSGNSPP